MFKYYRLGWNTRSTHTTPINIFMADGHMMANGFFDRLKGIISIYALSKVEGRKFGIYFVKPFKLDEYLLPNKYDWRVSGVNYIFPYARLIIANRQFMPYFFNKKNFKEGHFYFSFDILDEINKRYNQSFEFGILYRELFKMSPQLEATLDEHILRIGTSYIAVHIRMVNLLGEQIEISKDFQPIPLECRNSFLERMKSKIEEIHLTGKEGKIFISTDSNVFAEYMAKALSYIYIVPGEIKHIGNVTSTNHDENLKLFLDYLILSRSKKIYSIVGQGLYPSAFPVYAAKIGNIPFERVSIL